MSSLVLNKNWFLIKFFSPLILCAMSPSRYFGSTCFVHNLGPKKDNLDPHIIKFVSFGYSRTLKGYKCYGPSLCYHFVSAYVSADVTFFKSLSSLRKEVLLNSTPWFIVIPTSLSLSFHLFLMIPLLLPAVMSLFTYIGYSLYLGIHLLIASWVYHASTFYSSNWRFHSWCWEPQDFYLPIALRKGRRSCATAHPISSHLSYAQFSYTSVFTILLVFYIST